MITCVVHYTINPDRIEAFERFAREWMRLVALHGGIHHGYFLPAEGASDQAEALFSFDSLAAYERYRTRFGADPESSRRTESATTPAVCCGTSERSCAHSCRQIERTRRLAVSRRRSV